MHVLEARLGMRKIPTKITAIQINSTKKPAPPLFLLFFQKASVRFRFVPFGKRQSFVRIGTGIKCTRAERGKETLVGKLSR
jgi:hypothetical protein